MHPYHARHSKSEHARHLIRRSGYAHGGEAKSDKRSDEKMITEAVHEHEDHLHAGKRTKLKFKDGGAVEGFAAGGRLDKFARGGRKGKAHTKINIVVAPHPPGAMGVAGTPPMVPPPGMAVRPPPAVGPGAPMPPGIGAPGAGPPPGMPMGPKPPGMMRKGGAVKSPKAGAMDHEDGKRGAMAKEDNGRKPPHITGGAMGGLARMEKVKAYGKRGK